MSKLSTMQDEAPRVLFLPNEADQSQSSLQIGPRAAFNAMEQDGIIQELETFSFLYDFRKDRDAGRAKRELIALVERFRPDILFWQHPDDYPLDVDMLREIKRIGANPLIVYHEADPFDNFYKRLGTPQTALFLESDIFLTVSLGAGRRVFEAIRSHPAIYHTMHSIDLERTAVDQSEINSQNTKFDAVMIGSIAYRMRRLLKHPGSAERIKLARGLYNVFGNRFATFGRGWPSGTGNKGFLPFPSQGKTIRQSRMSVIWENFPEHTFYCSDRLAISLAAGRPHLTSRRPGYELMFRNVPGLYFADTVQDLIDIAIYLRGLPMDEMISQGYAARAWVIENLQANVVFRKDFEICKREWRLRRAQCESP